MPLSLSSIAITEKNKLGTDSVFLALMEVTIPGLGTPLRVAGNTESVTWNALTWTPFPFTLGDITEDGKGEVPSLTINIGNESRVMEQYIQAYDLYCKTNGYSPISCVIYVINTKNIGSSTPESSHYFDLDKISSDTKWATFTIGAGNPWRKRVPLNRIIRNQCRWVFKSTECGYFAVGSLCGKTLTSCRSYNATTSGQTMRFGGFVGVGNTGIRLDGI